MCAYSFASGGGTEHHGAFRARLPAAAHKQRGDGLTQIDQDSWSIFALARRTCKGSMRHREGREGRTSRQVSVNAAVPGEDAPPKRKKPTRTSRSYLEAGPRSFLKPVTSLWTGAMRANIATANFSQLRLGERRRINLPRTPVHKGKEEGRGCHSSRPEGDGLSLPPSPARTWPAWPSPCPAPPSQREILLSRTCRSSAS